MAMAIFDEARRLLVRQEADLESLRGRAITLVSTAAVAAALFGDQLPPERSTVADVALAVTLIAFTVTVGLATVIVWPTEWGFSHDPATWIDDLGEGRKVTLVEWTANLSRDFESSRAANQTKIRRRYEWLAVVCVLLAVQVGAWLVAIA